MRFIPRVSRSFNLQWRLNLFIGLGIFILLLNFPVVYFEVKNMNERILSFELAEDLHNTILELRRYEKNFFLYHDKESLESTRHYFSRAGKLFARILARFKKPSIRSEMARLDTAMSRYGALGWFEKFNTGDNRDHTDEEKIRTLGKQVVEASKALLKEERDHVSRVAKNALRWPLVFMGAMFFLFLLSARTIIGRVVRPLAMIERATEKVASGDFSPIPHTGRGASQVDHLVVAFNRMAKELEAREEQVIHSRKIASMGTLVSGVAHELNNPINNIVLTADVLSGKKEMPAERRSALLQDILSQALRASDIVKNLLEFSRAETSGYTELDPARVLRETIHLAENHIALSNVKLHDKIADQLPLINGNLQGLQQVFLNLITNAVQAMPEGGDLTIRAALEDTHKIKVDVIDTGSGIAPEHLPHIFDPFFTTKDVGQGTGLGLSVSFGIIKKHGGQITAKSEKGKGTAFTVMLPVHEKVSRE